MTLLAALALAPSADATTYIAPLGLESLAERSERAVVGEVLNTWTERCGAGVCTVASILVDETLAGEHETLVEARWPGGRIGEFELVVAGAPRFREGDKTLLFLELDGDVVGMAQGAFSIHGDTAVRNMDNLSFTRAGEAADAAESFSLDEVRAFFP